MHSGNGSQNRPIPSPRLTHRRFVGITSYGNAATRASHPIPSLQQGQPTFVQHPVPSSPIQATHIMQPPPASVLPQSHQNAYNYVPLPNHPGTFNPLNYGNQLPPPNPVFSQNIQGVPTGPYTPAAAPQPFGHMAGTGPVQMTQYGVYQGSVPSYGMLYGNYEEIKGPPHSHAARGQPLPIPVSPSSNRASHSPYTPLPSLPESLAPAPAGSSVLRAPAPRGTLRAPLADGIVRVPCRWGTCTILLDDLTVAGIKRHLRDHHPDDGVEKSKGQSGVCQWSHGGVCHRKLDVASFGKHIASVHLKSTAVPCPYCHTIIGRQDSLERHKRDHCPKRPM